MAHIFQVGLGSGGILVLESLLRDPRITRLTLIDPDLYKSHNVYRHLFPKFSVGRLKTDLAAEWVHQHRPELPVDVLSVDVSNPDFQERIEHLVASADLGICAVDRERAKYHFDALMRKARKPWTLGEVLSGGIGGWFHRFVPDGPCYGCVASYLRREVREEEVAPSPDYTNPTPSHEEESIPASRASVATMAALQANLTLELLDTPQASTPINVLLSMKAVPGIFEEAYRTYRFAISRSPDCLMCHEREPISGELLDEALDHALARLGSG